MIPFSELNPAVIFIYYICAAAPCAFSMNPAAALISFTGALSLWVIKNGKKDLRFHIFAAVMFPVIAVINPLFSHNGKTVLFVLNNNPVTLEAVYYGLVMAAVIIAALYWAKNFTASMTTDKLLYVFGKVSPKTALILSMAVRMIPLYRAQACKTEKALTGMGLNKDESYIDRFTGKARVFSAMITWAAENAVVTADSMAARGYTGEKRTSFSLWKFSVPDFVFLAVCVLLCVPVIVSAAAGKLEFIFYPAVSYPETAGITAAAYVSYALLCFIPFLSEAGDKLKWRYFQSKI